MSAATGEIGLDLTSFVVTSEDERVKALKQLRRAQQTVSRRKQGSKNREKARIRVAKIHQRVTDIPTD